MPGAWTSCSMSACGAKYPVCGPKTASGRPLADRAADTRMALDIAPGNASEERAVPPPAPSPAGDGGAPGAVGTLSDPAPVPLTWTSATFTDPGSGSARPTTLRPGRRG